MKLKQVAAPKVINLVCSSKGNYKELSNGKRIKLTDKEWKVELSKCFAK